MSSAPFATLGKLEDALLFPGDTATLSGAFREQFTPDWGWDASDSRVTIRGNGAQIIGSDEIAGTWELVTGTEYKTALAYTARNAFWITGETISEAAVTKLTLGAAGALADGQFGTSDGFLHVNIGQDPTGQRIEVPRSGSCGLLLSNANSVLTQGVEIYFADNEGVAVIGGANNEVRGCTINWNGEDGVGVSGAADLDVTNCTILRNGGERTAMLGRGDGVSYHDTCSGTISGNAIRDNEKGGVVNQAGCTVIITGNTIRHCNRNLEIITGSEGGTHTIANNTIIAEGDDENAMVMYGVGTANATGNTIYVADLAQVDAGSFDAYENNTVTVVTP
jgi:hypothetical protein